MIKVTVTVLCTKTNKVIDMAPVQQLARYWKDKMMEQVQASHILILLSKQFQKIIGACPGSTINLS